MWCTVREACQVGVGLNLSRGEREGKENSGDCLSFRKREKVCMSPCFCATLYLASVV